jgi:hypothetical protein
VHPGDLLAVADGSELREGQRVRVTSAGSETMEGGSL